MSTKRSNIATFNSNIKWILMSIFMLLLIIVIVRLTTNIPFNVLVLNIGGKDQITSTTSTSTEPVTTSTAPIQQQYKSNQAPSSPILKNDRPTSPTSNSSPEPVSKVQTAIPVKGKEVLNEKYIAPRKEKTSITPNREATYNSSPDPIKDKSYSPPIRDNSNSDKTNVSTSADQTNGNSPYSYNRSSAYSPKSNASITNSLKAVDTKKYSTISSRYFSQSEMDEFKRQYPNKSTYIHFVNFGSVDDEMEGVRLQIIGMLNSNGYYEIDKNWFVYNGYTVIKEVHFGVNGNTAVNFYIPPIKY